MGPREIFLTTVVPGTIVGVALLVAWMLNARRKDPGQGPQWIVPIAFAIAFIVAFWTIDPLARWWPNTGSQRLPHIAASAMLAGLGCVWLGKFVLARHVITAVSIAVAVWMTIGSLPAATLVRGDLAIWITAVAVGGAILLAATDAAASNVPRWLPAMQFMLVALAASLICLFSQIALFSILAGTLVAIATAASIVSMIRKDATYWPGGTLFLYTLIASLCVGASQYAQYPVHLSAYLLVLCAPLGSLAARIPHDESTRKWKPVLFGFVGVLAPLIGAVIIGYVTRHVSVPYDY